MGKFDGILLATDLDGTLFDACKKISKKNIDAIKYYISEGGYFTLATGRSQLGIKSVLGHITPNAPIIIFNGAAIYDTEKDEMIEELFLDSDAVRVVDMVERDFPDFGIAVSASDTAYASRMTDLIRNHFVIENIPEKILHHRQVTNPWRKAIFTQEPERIDELKSAISKSEFYDRYDFSKSASTQYELLPKGVTKGLGLKMLAEFLNVDISKTIAVGDNENDIEMIRAAKIGVAVENATVELKKVADYITVDNNSDALFAVIDDLDKKRIKI